MVRRLRYRFLPSVVSLDVLVCLRRSRLRILSLLLSALLLQSCAHLVIDDDDHPATKAGKVLSRIVLCPITLCISEAEISGHASRKDWQDRADHPMTVGSARTHPRVGDLMIVAGDHTIAVSTVITTLQQMGARLVERSRVEQLFSEQRFRLTYSSDRESDYLKIGQMAGADQIVFVTVESNPAHGTYGEVASYRPAVLIRSVSVASGEIMWSGQAHSRIDVANADPYAATLAWWAIHRIMCPPERWNDKRGCDFHRQAPIPPSSNISSADLDTLRTRAAQGDAQAQYNLGMLYVAGKGVPQDYARAREWWEKAAAQGYAQAQYNLGMLYAKGKGVPQDYARAREWWEKAAAQGLASAQNNLGYLYADGKGVSKDEKKGVEWIRKAAEQGDANGQDSLGEMYRDGRGVPQDYLQAYMWFNLSVEQYHRQSSKNAEAEKHRDAITSQLTPDQINDAKRLTQQCQAKQFKGC